MTKIRDVIKILDSWIPADIGWDRDNTGFQLGDTGQEVRKILLCLDLTPKVLAEAITSGANLIISHHPLLFNPLKSINPSDPTGHLVFTAIQNNITIYSAHTNLDFIFGGVSTVLAERIGLTSVSILDEQYGHTRKLEVFVPADSADVVFHALSDAGAGEIGNYTHCSFRSRGEGSFLGNESSHPVTGTAGQFEKVEEIKLEMVFPKWKEKQVLSALKKSHPYEEIAFNLITLANSSSQYGAGAWGTLESPIRLKDFITSISNLLGSQGIRYSGDPEQTVSKVAVCGGAGADLISKAAKFPVDCLVTADIRYHQFFYSTPNFSIVDAGHFETEVVVLDAVKAKINLEFPGIQVEKTKIITNPIQYHNK